MYLLTGRFWWTGFVALIVLLAACSSSSAEPDSPSDPSATASVANPTDTPATEDEESRSPTVSPAEAPPTAGGESPTVAPVPETLTTEPESPTIAPAPASPTADPDAQTEESASAVDSPEVADEATELMRATLEQNVIDITEQMVASGNKSFIPVMMEIMRFVQPNDPRFCLVCSMNTLLEGPDGIDVPPERRNWGWWVEWLGNHPEVQPPDGFAGWKGELYSGIDPSFVEFLYDGVKTRIRLEEIAWGGVRKDGIPDLINPPVIPAGQATYLQDTDRVFGVSINGEHRAYPLRILNPHEMANDVVGGVPFALAY